VNNIKISYFNDKCEMKFCYYIQLISKITAVTMYSIILSNKINTTSIMMWQFVHNYSNPFVLLL